MAVCTDLTNISRLQWKVSPASSSLRADDAITNKSPTIYKAHRRMLHKHNE